TTGRTRCTRVWSRGASSRATGSSWGRSAAASERREAMPPHLDKPGRVRAGEELELEPLAQYLRQKLPIASDATLTIEQFPSGHSNLTYLVHASGEDFVLRRPPFGSKVKSAHDMGRE